LLCSRREARNHSIVVRFFSLEVRYSFIQGERPMKNILAAVILCLTAWSVVPAFAEIPAEPLVTVNINNASAAEIAETLNGIGLAKAEAIVAYREENGGFESVDQLTVVKGIGPATIDKNRERIALQ